MDINEKVKSIILEVNEADLSSEEIRDVMKRILSLGEWEDVRNGLLNILYDNDQTLWNETIIYIYYLQGEGYKFEDVKTIAVLNNCLTLSEELNGNLIWTITIGIKSISYLSDYDPFQDKEVLSEMSKIEKMRNGA
ncbi:MAG: hypothetical protein ABUT20_23940 [Bacteroidota bacterium]